MAKHLNVDLSFNANTAQAKQSILDLQKTLQQIATQPININDKSIQQSVEAAKQLTYHLNAAFNTSTGKLDLTAFNTSLKRSNTNVTTLSSNLLQSGQIGQQAFIQLAQAVSQAEYPMLRVNRRLTEMWTTMKNTARWQLSSSILHGFIGAVQKAHGYAQDLNESLNNIRIVTGYSVDDMADFAEEANKAAKALRTTTTEYTNASLIYYQQGLNKEQVLERADVTVKLANVARQSAETVSDQMTAVWNNFYDGSQSLEYYADVMTALGATTASSTDEIAGGLEKFAAVADTIGLSYEYAASALATITSNTRQSEEVVGTALKTIFARIQGLNLGETLEDGTTLNKYSEALEKVGISIFDSTGELKKMDTILDEMGSKWQTLAKDQQVALAQTVAGVRQYNQLVSLMDNWDAGDADSMQANLETSYNASGALQEQADIYAESWEAASKKVQTSLEGIYQALLDDEFFIGFNNGLADVLSGVERFIESIGGVKGVVSSIGTVLLSVFAGKIEPALRSTIQNITVLFTGARGQIQKFVQDMSQINEQQIATGKYNTAQQQSLTNARQLTAARQQLSIASKNMSEQEARMAEFTLQGLSVQQDQAQAVAESIVQLENQRTTLLETAAAVDLNTEAQRAYSSTLRILTSEQAAARTAYMQDDGADIDSKINAYHRAREATEFYQSAQTELKYTLEMSTNAILDNYKAIDAQEENMSTISSQVVSPFAAQIADLSKQLQSNTTAFGSETNTLMVYADALQLIQKSMPPLIRDNAAVKKAFNEAFDARKPQDFIRILNSLSSKITKTKFTANQLKLILKSLDGKKFLELENNADALSKKQQELLNIQKQLNAAFASFNPTHMVTGLERIAASAAAFGQISMIATSLRSTFNALSSEVEMSLGERITTVLMGISMLVPATIGAFKNLSKAIQGTTLETWLYTLSMKAQKKTTDEINATLALKAALQKGEAGQAAALAAIKTLVIAALDKEGIALNKAAKAEFDKIVADELAQGSDLKTAITKALVALKTNTSRQAVDKETAAKVANKVATDALNTSLKSLLGWIGLIIIAVTAVVAIFQAWSKAQEEAAKRHAEGMKERAEATLEEAQAYKTAREEYEQLLDTYKTAIENNDGTVGAQEAIAQATWDLCEALGVEIDLLDKLQGKSESYIFKAREEEAIQALDQLKKYQDGLEDLQNGILGDFAETATWYDKLMYDESGYGIGVMGTTTGGDFAYQADHGIWGPDEWDVQNAIRDYVYSDDFKWSGLVDSYHGGDLTFDSSLSASDHYEIIKDILTYVEDNVSGGKRDGSEVYHWYKTLLKDAKDSYNNVDEIDFDENIKQYAIAGAEAEQKQLISSIETYEDFMAMKEVLIEKIKEGYLAAGLEIDAQAAEDLAIQYLNLENNVQTLLGLGDVSEKTKIDLEKIKALYEEYGDEVFWRVNFDTIQSEEELKGVLEHLQKLVNSENLIIRWNLLPAAKSELKDNMSTEEYQTWLNKYSKDLFGEGGMLGGMSADTFSSLSYDKQQSLLSDAYDFTNMNEVYNNAIANQQSLLDSEKNNVPELQKISINQAAANQGIYNVDSDILWYFKQFGDLENKKNTFNSADIVAQQADVLKNLASLKGVSPEEMMQQLLPIIEQYGPIVSIGQKISEEYATQNAALKEQYEKEVESHKETINGYEKNIADLQAEQKLVAQSQLTSRFENANSLGDIYAARDFGIDNKIDINYDTYAEALTRVASAYSNCADEMTRYQAILRQSKEENSSITEDQIAQAQANLEASIAVGELAEAHDLNAEAIERYADELASSGKYSKANQKALVGMAKDQLRFDRAVNTATSNMEDWIKDLEVAKKTGHLVSETAEEMASAYGDLLDIDGSDLSADFLKNQTNFENLKKALEGDEAAYRALQEAARKDIAVNIGINDEEFQTDFANLMEQCQMGSLPDLEVGASLDNQDFLNGLSEMVNKAGMTAEQATNYLSAMGVDAEVITEPETVKEVQGYNLVATPGTEQIQYNPGADAGGVATATYPTVTYTPEPVYTEKTVTGTALKVTSASKSSGGGIKHTGSTTANDGSNATKPSGGGSKPSKTSKTHQTKVVDRYKEINDALEDSKKAMDDASRAAEGLWGAARLKKMKEVRDEMGKQLNLLRQRKAAAMTDLTEDQNWLNNTIAQEYGITFTFDQNDGTISNYYEIMDQLHQELRDAEIRAGETLDKDSESEEIDAINEKISALQGAIDIYEATRKEINDTDTAIKEMIRSIQEANLEELNLQLEMEIMIDDAQLKKIEYYLGKTKEDIWGMAEAAALMTGQSKDLFNIDLGQAEVWTGKFADFQKQYEDLVYAYTHIDPKTGETFINQEQFVKALEELQSQIYDNLGNINELDKTMIGYYGETLAAAAEELSKFTDMMDHHNEVLDHYQSLLEIMGKSKDFDRMKTLLKTQVEVSKNSAEVSKANYEMLQAELAEKKAAYEALDPNDTSYEAQVIKQQWLDAQAAANEAQLKMLEDAEAWAESLKALLETELEELGDNLEKALAGDFGSLDYMMTSMERANSLQEEYLTTTNKVYETNKLMRTAQQEIDKTSNTVAKRRMAQFIEETQQMQNQNKLSQYELEIQQAKYDLLLAEIALEEAQSAKSTVRLQRDSEGNFGYVYTADQNEVANAQQQLEDAQNALYNIGLEGANKYAEQYAQTIQEMNDAVRELTEQWQNGEIASKEEYQAKMLELEEYYGEKLKQFSHLHSVAVQTDSRVTNEAWTRDFAHMTTQTSTWMSAVTGYASQVGVAFGKYQQGIAEVEQYAGADLDSLKTKTEDIKKENEKLVTSITDPDKGLLHAMQLEIDKVDDITKKYQDWRKEIQGAIKDQENLAKIIGQEIENETDDDESNDRKPETETPPEQTLPQSESNGSPGDDGTPSYKKGILSWTGNGSARIWTDSAGKTYSAASAEGRAIQAAFNKAYSANGGYKGDYFIDWNRLNADVLHEKYGLSTGGYTGDWSGSFGKLAFLHQKELVLNKQDTENLLAAMEFLNRITSAIDLQAMNNSLGGLLSSPSLGHVGDESGILEQQVHIEASFPGISDRNELEEAFNNLINQAAQYANRK